MAQSSYPCTRAIRPGAKTKLVTGTSGFHEGDHVVLLPWALAYARDDRYGIVEYVHEYVITVKLDKSGLRVCRRYTEMSVVNAPDED